MRTTRNVVVGGGGLIATMTLYYSAVWGSKDSSCLAISLFAILGILLLVAALGVVLTCWRQDGSLSLVALSGAVISLAGVHWYAAWPDPLRTSDALTVIRCILLVPAAFGAFVLIDRFVNNAHLGNPTPFRGWKSCSTWLLVHFFGAGSILTTVLFANEILPESYSHAVSLSWARTSGAITSWSPPASPSAEHHVQIDYRYSVDGKQYLASGLVPYIGHVPNSIAAKMVGGKLGQVTVFYDANRPHRSVLHTGFSCSQSFALMVLVGIVAFAGAFAHLLSMGPTSLRGEDLHDQLSPSENASAAGLFSCSICARLLLPVTMYEVLGESRTGAIIAWGLLIAIVWLVAKLSFRRAEGRLSENTSQSGVLVS